MNATFNVWRDTSPFSIGFDNRVDTFDRVNAIQKYESYTPYNIKKLSD